MNQARAQPGSERAHRAPPGGDYGRRCATRHDVATPDIRHSAPSRVCQLTSFKGQWRPGDARSISRRYLLGFAGSRLRALSGLEQRFEAGLRTHCTPERPPKRGAAEAALASISRGPMVSSPAVEHRQFVRDRHRSRPNSPRLKDVRTAAYGPTYVHVWSRPQSRQGGKTSPPWIRIS